MINEPMIIGKLDYNVFKQEISNSNEPLNIKQHRLNYLEKAFSLELPNAPDEAWRRTDLSRLKLDDLQISTPYISVKANLSKGIVVKNYGDAIKENPELIEKLVKGLNKGNEYDKDTSYSSNIKETKFVALSESLSLDGLFIKIPKDIDIKKPIIIDIRNLTENSAIFPMICILVEENASADFILQYGSYKNNTASFGLIKVMCEKHSMVKFLNFQRFGEYTSSYHTETFTIDENAHLEYDIISTGSKSSMWDSSFNLVDTGAEVNANGLLITQNKQFIGNKMSIYHNAPKTNSNLSMKSILKDKSKTLFVGNIKIPKDSQKCNGYQKCDNLILGDKARADVIPRLEIIADDVKCSHGATVGSIDAEKLFYLTSRGLSKEKAENFIIKSFYNDVLRKMSILNKEKYLKNNILSKLKEKLFSSKKEE